MAVGCSVSLLCLDQPHLVLEACPSTGHLRVDVHNHHVHLLSCDDHCFFVRDCLQFGILHDLVQSGSGELVMLVVGALPCGCVIAKWVCHCQVGVSLSSGCVFAKWDVSWRPVKLWVNMFLVSLRH